MLKFFVFYLWKTNGRQLKKGIQFSPDFSSVVYIYGLGKSFAMFGSNLFSIFQNWATGEIK